MGLRRDGQVDKGRQVVSARHGPDGGPRAPLGGLKRPKKWDKSYLRGRGPNGGRGPRWKMARNRQRETRQGRAASRLSSCDLS